MKIVLGSAVCAVFRNCYGAKHCGAKWAQIAKLRAYVGISL